MTCHATRHACHAKVAYPPALEWWPACYTSFALHRTAQGSRCVLHAGKYRKYSYGSLRDLLRVIRNKHNHFR